eukprot:6491543-Amphidinium_carterae.1
MENALTYVFLPRRPDTFPKHRWTGGDAAIDFMGRLESVHHLLSLTFEKYVATFQKPMFKQMGTSGTSAGIAMGPVQDMDEAILALEEALGGEVTANLTCHEGTTAEDAGEGGESAAQHAHDRKVALAWVRTAPHDTLILLRQAVEPLRVLLSHHFDMSGENFEVRQRAIDAKNLTRPGESFSKRDFMITLAASNKFEQAYFDQLHLLRTDIQQWSVVSERSHTNAFRALAFKICSRQGALIWQLVGVTHVTFPCRMFSLLRNPGLATEIINTPDCVLDSWSLQLRSLHPSLSGPAFQQLLLAHALSMVTNISSIEARHATLRRLLTSRTQTWGMRLPTVSAQWLLHGLRKRRFSKLLARAQKSTAPSTRKLKRAETLWYNFLRVNLCLSQFPTKVVKQLKRKHIGGGTFRAFISRVFSGKKGCRPDFRGVSADYWEHVRNQDASFLQDKAVGRAARHVAYHKGSQNRSSNFGPSQRSLQRVAAKNAQKLLWERTKNLDGNDRSKALVEFAAFRGMGLKALVAMARSQHKQDGQALMRAFEENMQEIVAYQTSLGQEALSKIAAALPGMQLSKDTLTPVPSELGHVFEVHPPDTEKVSESMAWAAASHTTNVASAFQQQWLLNHKTVECDKCEPIGDPPPQPKVCREAGRCLCSSEGTILKAIKASVLDNMRKRFKGKQRSMLMDGQVVLQLSGKSRDCSNTEAHVQHWLYVSAMYLRPFRPTYELLMPYAGEDLCED